MPEINLNPYTAESEAIAKRLRMAEMLAQQSMQPIDIPQQAGVKFSPLSGLAKVLDAYTAGKEARTAKEEQKNLAQQYQTDVATDLASIFRDMRAPAQPGMVMGDDTMQGARPAGYLDPANLQAMKTPIGQQTYMAQLLAKPEAPIKASAGDVFFDRSGKEIFRAPEKPEFGTTPQYEKDPNSPTGYVAVQYGKKGERLVVGPVNPMNQYTTPTVDAAESLKQRKEESDRNFNQLSANQKAQLANEAQRIGISAQELFFNTGMGAPTAGAPVGAVAPRPAPITAAPTGMPTAAPTAAPTTAYTPLGAPPALSPKAQQDIAVAAAKEQFRDKPLTETQSNAVAFGMRMKESNAIIEDLAKQGVLRGANIESAPFVGEALGKILPSALGGTSPAQQQVNQAKSNFITAVLRKESGAAIGPDEFATEDRKYFPQLNDSPQVLQQKANARKLAIEAMQVQAGPGAKTIQEMRSDVGADSNDP
jgi:hypothetical protein